MVGRFAFGMGVFGGDNAVLSNSGTLTVGRDGFGMARPGQRQPLHQQRHDHPRPGRLRHVQRRRQRQRFSTPARSVGGNGATGMGNDSGNNPTMTNTGTIVLGDGGTAMGTTATAAS